MSTPIDASRPPRSGEELDIASLQTYLREALPDCHGPLEIEQFPSGFSNLTYLLRFPSVEFVLRRPPFGNPVKTAHDMGREFRVLSKLSEVYEPAPRPVAYCADHHVLGDEFYIMERRRGVVLRGATPPTPLATNPDIARRLSESFIDNLALLHTLDYRAAGLGELGKPEGYVARQVDGWSTRYRAARTDDVPRMDDLIDWLAANQPVESTAALIHNDYKYDNLVLDPDDLTRIIAVLDWEMATIGDPLMDVGSSLAYWIEATDPPPRIASAFGPTMAPGSLARRELVERYAARTGRDVADALFYYCFGVFKLAGIVQQIYARYVRGSTADERFSDLHRMVRLLERTAVDAIDAGTI